MKASILIVDDEPSVLSFMESCLKEFNTRLVSNGLDALEILTGNERFDVVISDLRLPGATGIDLLKRAKEQDLPPEVVLITGHGEVSTAVRAMKLGALDYLQKPLEPEEVTAIANKAVEIARLRNQSKRLREQLDSARGLGGFIGQSEASRNVQVLMDKAADATELPVLIFGEAGSGKELAARGIHERSIRSERPFFTYNARNLTSKSFELLQNSSGGTVFIDEIEALSDAMQAELYSLLGTDDQQDQSPKLDYRLITATGENMFELVDEGKFHKELFLRLNVLPLKLPPIRERKEDIELLATVFLENSGVQSRVKSFSPEAMKTLREHDWPGNIRELRNCIEAAAALADGSEIVPEDLPLLEMKEMVAQSSDSIGIAENWLKMTYFQAIEYGKSIVTQQYLTAILRESSGNVSKAARLARIERQSLHRLLKKYDIDAAKLRQLAKEA